MNLEGDPEGNLRKSFQGLRENKKADKLEVSSAARERWIRGRQKVIHSEFENKKARKIRMKSLDGRGMG